MSDVRDRPRYERDFYAWTQDQAARLRALTGSNAIDSEHLAEEVEDLGRNALNQVHTHLVQLFAHLLVAACSPSEQPQRHWRSEIRQHHLHAVTAFSPSMRQKLDRDRIWRQAIALANDKLVDAGETQLPAPLTCPFTLDEILNETLDLDAARSRVAQAAETARAGG